MTVRELIEKLGQMDTEADVLFTYDYGDRTHTMVAAEVEEVESESVVWSNYHQQLKLVGDYDHDKNPKRVVVLR